MKHRLHLITSVMGSFAIIYHCTPRIRTVRPFLLESSIFVKCRLFLRSMHDYRDYKELIDQLTDQKIHK